MQARNFATNVPKILDLKSSSEQIFIRKLSLGAPDDIRKNSSALNCPTTVAQKQTHSSRERRKFSKYPVQPVLLD